MSTLQAPHNNALAPVAATPDKQEKKAEKVDPTPLFWRMFGASTMAIACSMGIVLYFQIAQNINGLRSDVSMLREGYVQLVPKSEFSKGHSQLTTEIQTLQAKNLTALEIWTSRVAEQERKIERMRNEHKEQVDAFQREIQQLRERLVVLENRTAPAQSKK